MRIAINTRMLLPNRLEGIGWYTYEVVRRMVDAHPEHQFIFFFDRAYDPEFVFAPNVEPVVLHPPARHPLLFMVWFDWAIPRALRKHRADLFFSPDGFLSLRTSVPTLLTVHDLAYKHFPDQVAGMDRWYYRRFMPRFMQHADRIVTVSEATRMDVIESGISPAKVSVSYNGANPRFTAQPVEEGERIRNQYTQGEPYFLYVGAIHPRKNVTRLVRAFSLFKEETGCPHRLVLLGRMAWMAADTKAAIVESPFREHIIQVGYQGGDLPAFYSGAEALVYVSLFEGFGIPIVEAMGCETAVITSDRSSMAEVAADAAILVNPESEAAIAEGMARLVREPGLRQELIEKGTERRTRFDWDRTAREVWSLLEEMDTARTE
ncbi:MAG: glycosyltransferase family 4 protein [Saprospiraceae bacterium]|nr:glycosyltransferase family 4 protein [Saprospiraceae bacterium]